jgi:hypothetical protein
MKTKAYMNGKKEIIISYHDTYNKLLQIEEVGEGETKGIMPKLEIEEVSPNKFKTTIGMAGVGSLDTNSVEKIIEALQELMSIVRLVKTHTKVANEKNMAFTMNDIEIIIGQVTTSEPLIPCMLRKGGV